MGRLFTTGEVANQLGLTLRQVDHGIRSGWAGQVIFAGGRRLLSPENLRALAHHFSKPLPPEALADLDAADLTQEGRPE